MATRDFSVLTSNFNAQLDFDANHSIHQVTGGQLFPDKSEFKRALKRRQSRQSVRAKSVIDFEYIGNDTSVMESVIGKSNKSQLDHQLNLRRHKDNTEFKPSKAWRFPANKEFGV